METTSIDSESERTDFSEDEAGSQQEPRVLTEQFDDRAEPAESELAALEVEKANVEEDAPESKDFELGAFYSKAVSEHKVLSHQQVLQLYGQMKGVNADEARGKMILHNLRLVWFIAKKYQYMGVSREDLIQEGTLGLMKAVDKFDPSRGFRFATYAIWWIRQSVGRFIQEQGSQVRLPVNIHDLRRRIKRAGADLRHKLGRRPTIDEIAESAECTKEKVIQAFEGVGNASFSFDATVFTANGDPGSTHGDLFIDDHQVDPSESLLNKEGSSEVSKELRLLLDALETIPQRKATMFKDCYGLTEDSRRLYNNLELTGAKLNLTRERIRQVRNQVWGTLKVRYPGLKLDHRSLSTLRANTGFFEEVWNQVLVENPVNGHSVAQPPGSRVKRFMVNGRRGSETPIAHIRASPAYVRWRPSKKSKSLPGELVLEFVSLAYEVPEEVLRGHRRQEPESIWARHVAAYIMFEDLRMDPKEVRMHFVDPYRQQVAERLLVVPETMQNDPLVRKDIEGMREHFAGVVSG